MEFSGLSARDLPAPGLLADDVAAFAVPMFSLARQARLRFADHSAVWVNNQLTSVALTYSYLADPAHPEAAENLVDNIDEVRGWIRKAEQDDQPDWFKQGLLRARYPVLWEAVQTAIDPDRLREGLDQHLVAHVNHVLINTMEHRVQGSAHGIPSLDHAVRISHVQAAEIIVEDQRVEGLKIDTDPDIIGWGVEVSGAYVTICLPRDRAPEVDRRLVAVTDPINFANSP